MARVMRWYRLANTLVAVALTAIGPKPLNFNANFCEKFARLMNPSVLSWRLRNEFDACPYIRRKTPRPPKWDEVATGKP